MANLHKKIKVRTRQQWGERERERKKETEWVKGKMKLVRVLRVIFL